MSRARSTAALAAVVGLFAAAPAEAEIRDKYQPDPRGDSSVTFSNGSRLLDMTGVGVAHDTEGGTLRVRLDADLPGAIGSISFDTSISQSVKDGACAVHATSEDYTVRGSAYNSYGYVGGSAYLYHRDRLVDTSGQVSLDAAGVTVTFRGFGLVRRNYLCVGTTSVSRSVYGNGFSGSSSDEVVSFCLVDGCGIGTQSSGSKAGLEVPVPVLDLGTVTRGTTIVGKAELKNSSRDPIHFTAAVISARPPGSSRAVGPIMYYFNGLLPQSPVPAGGSRLIDQRFTIPSDAPFGRYDVYATYQDLNGAWHDGPSGFLEVVADPRRTGERDPEPNKPDPRPVTPGGGSGGGGGEGVNRGGGGTPGTSNPNTGNAGTTPSVVTVPGGLEVELGSLGTRLRNLQRSAGVRVRYACSKACELDARLTLRGRVVARGDVARARAGSGRMTLRTTSTGRRRLRNLRSATFVLTLKVTDGDGDVRTLRRTVRMR